MFVQRGNVNVAINPVLSFTRVCVARHFLLFHGAWSMTHDSAVYGRSKRRPRCQFLTCTGHLAIRVAFTERKYSIRTNFQADPHERSTQLVTYIQEFRFTAVHGGVDLERTVALPGMSKLLKKGLRRGISYEPLTKAPPVSALSRSRSTVLVDEDGEFHDAEEVTTLPCNIKSSSANGRVGNLCRTVVCVKLASRM